MSRFSTILCPVDFEPNSLRVLRLAGEIAQEHKATLHVLHVTDIPIPPKPEVTVPFDKMETVVTVKLNRLARLRAARRLGANLIIMATHGRRGLRHLVLGSVAERVVREARCPVLTIRGGRNPG